MGYGCSYRKHQPPKDVSSMYLDLLSHCQLQNMLKIGSVVAIHGLGGDAYRTWTHENKKLWLQDFLPSQVPEARILSYGYDSTVAFSKSSAGIDDFSRDFLYRLKTVRNSTQENARPIFFICHSLGGILFKQVYDFQASISQIDTHAVLQALNFAH